MDAFFWVACAYALLAPIHTLDKRLIQSARRGEDFGQLPGWVMIFSYLMYGCQIAMLVIDWQKALVVFGIMFLLACTPILETIGNVLCAPLNWFPKTMNSDVRRMKEATRRVQAQMEEENDHARK
jgi:hypothetical protein